MDEKINETLDRMDGLLKERHQQSALLFDEFLALLRQDPEVMIRDVFQAFYDMMKAHVDEDVGEYAQDPESVQFTRYDCTRLFVDHADQPFFADRLFAARLMNHVESLRRGAQQNKIYIFDGPPGCGKSTFLNNLLDKFEEHSKTEEGRRYEVVWRLDRRVLCPENPNDDLSAAKQALAQLGAMAERRSEFRENDRDNEDETKTNDADELTAQDFSLAFDGDFIEVPCPSHDHPLLMVPKHYRRKFFDDLFENDQFKWKLFTEKAYDWVFKTAPCTICHSIYWALLHRLKSPREVFKMLYVRPYRFNRRLGEGISVFNPGDVPMRQTVLTNPILQKRINAALRDSNQVKYIFSRYAKTNNGVYALMDIKSHNVERLIELHNIISEGLHKVEDVEENVHSLLIALMNPEDKKNIADLPSFSDRIEFIRIPYVLDYNTEAAIYRNIFGKHIDAHFLPRVLNNFAKVVVATRLSPRSPALLDWIGDGNKYRLFCDTNLQLLKMEIYAGHIPLWLSEEDRKKFTAKRKNAVLAEAKTEGEQGFSGRDAIKIFNDFFSRYAREDQLINMSMLCTYFGKVRADLAPSIPEQFLNSLLRMYDYSVLQEVKESLYYYNEEQIARDIKNYLFALNFEMGTKQTCHYTGDSVEINIPFLAGIENRVLRPNALPDQRKAFRTSTQKTYISQTLTRQIMMEGLSIEETELYKELFNRYVYNLKEKVLEPFLDNENFRRGIKDFGEEDFKSHDKRIREDVTFLMENLQARHRYTPQGAKEVCIYVIDNDLPRRFGMS